MLQIPENHTFTMQVRVTDRMTASFFGCRIHPVYATFALIEHAEYAARQAILPFLEADEDAVGTRVELEHTAPTAVGSIVTITADVVEVAGTTITCRIVARNGTETIAEGRQQQRVVSKQKLRQRFEQLYGR